MLVAKQPQIGQLVRSLHQHLNQSQICLKKDLLPHLGVSLQAVKWWENGRATPSALAMEKLEIQVKKLGAQGKELVKQYFTSHN